MKDRGLYERIVAFVIDEGPAALTFTKRLARENGWSLSFAERVVGEYKRFVYLAMVTGHPVTPSDEVDQAWHLHMLYTRSYFDRLCGEVLGRQLAHGPTKGGQEEGVKYREWYDRTKGVYRQEFGELPPGDVWPSSEVRFGDAPYFRRVNTKANFVLPKAAVKRAGLIASAILTIALIAGCTASLAQATELKTGTIVVIVVLVLVFIIAVAVAVSSKTKGGGGSGCRHR